MSLSLTTYRLCVSASGSLITVIFSFCTFTMLSCLHLGQKRGKFFSSVSSLTIIRVLLLHTGHKSQVASSDVFSISISPPLYKNYFFNPTVGKRKYTCHHYQVAYSIFSFLSALIKRSIYFILEPTCSSGLRIKKKAMMHKMIPIAETTMVGISCPATSMYDAVESTVQPLPNPTFSNA